MTLLQAALLSIFPALLIVAALTDATSFTIPNRISLIMAAAFFPAALALGLPISGVGLQLGMGVAALLAAMGMFAAGWIGGGDAKVFAAACLWLGWSALPAFLMVTAISGGVLAVTLLNVRAEWLQPYMSGAPGWLARLAKPGEAVPYGVAIAVGALAAFPQSALVHAFHGTF
jgi:prepilin peptidase CpaA